MTFQRRLLLAAGGGWLFDAMDLLLFASVVAVIGREWDLSKPVVGEILTANLLGMFVGASLSGIVADRFGRKAVFTWTLLAYSLLSGVTALAWSVGALALIRFLAGVGLGGELPVASTLVSEFAPKERRGRTIVLLESFWAYGTVLAALIGALVVPSAGWRAAMLIGVLPALYVFVLRRAIPESPRFLDAQGRTAEARAVAGEAGITLETPLTATRARLQELFAPAFAKRTVMLWLLWIALVFSYYGIFTWMPGLLISTKAFTVQQSLWLTLAIAVFQIPGYYAAAALVDRLGRKPTLVGFLACAAAGSFFFAGATLALHPSATAVIAWGAVIAFFTLGAWGVTYTYTPEQYPTAIRASGAGLAAGAGRLVGAFAPTLVGVMLARFGSPYSVFVVFAAVMLTGALVVLVLGEETRGKSLEEISETRLAA
jgi:putative MFS transporter